MANLAYARAMRRGMEPPAGDRKDSMVRTKAGVAVLAALALVPAAAVGAEPRKGADYTGTTAQGEVISFTIAPNGKRVAELATSLVYKCTGEHDGQSGTFVLDSIRIKNGRFVAKQVLYGTSETSVVEGGTGTVKGTFKRRGSRAGGVLRSRLELRSGETCDSGAVSFKVSLL